MVLIAVGGQITWSQRATAAVRLRAGALEAAGALGPFSSTVDREGDGGGEDLPVATLVVGLGFQVFGDAIQRRDVGIVAEFVQPPGDPVAVSPELLQRSVSLRIVATTRGAAVAAVRSCVHRLAGPVGVEVAAIVADGTGPGPFERLGGAVPGAEGVRIVFFAVSDLRETRRADLGVLEEELVEQLERLGAVGVVGGTMLRHGAGQWL